MITKFRKERGISTILLVMLISFASLVIFTASTYELKNSQDSSIAEHELLQAQARAWTGVEAVRQITLGIGATNALQLPIGYIFQLTKLTGLSASISSIDSANKQLIIDVIGCSDVTNSVCTLDNKNNQKGSVSKVQVILSVAGTSTTTAVNFNNVINIKGGLSLSGDIHVNGNTPMSLVVDGSLTTTGVTGIDNLYVTGDINVSGSGLGQNTITSAVGNVNISGSGTYGTIKSLKNVNIIGSSTSQFVQANGNVSISSATVDVVKSIGDILLSGNGKITTATTNGNINVTGGNVATANANGNVTVATGNNSNINAGGNVTVTQGTFQTINTNGSYLGTSGPSVKTLSAIGNITQTGGSINFAQTNGSLLQSNTTTNDVLVKNSFTETSWGSLMTGKVGVVINKTQTWNSNVHGTVIPGLNVPISPVAQVNVTPLTPMSVSQPSVNANLFKSAANYIFSYSGGNIMVKVSNVYNTPPGDYYLYEGYIGGQPYKDYICTTPNPTLPSQCLTKIGTGWSIWNTLITYNTSLNQWELSGNSMAPGVVFFNGDVNIANGTFYNTFLSSGNVITSASATVYSLNYAGYSNVCLNASYPKYPTQLCNAVSGSYVPNALGNIAILAGSYLNDGSYNGGNINMSSGGTTVYGDLIAGNYLKTGGSTSINGYITVANLGTGGSSFFSSTTNINLINLPSTYSPLDGIDLLYSTTGTNNQVTITPQSLVIGARYL